jgi:hypothetical protein
MKVRQAALLGAASVMLATSAFAQAREHVVCYAAKPTKKVCLNPADAGKLCEDDAQCSGVADACDTPGKFPKGVLARLNDDTDPSSVGEDKTFNIKKPTRLCIPVDKNDEGVDDPDVSYATYPVKQAKTVCDAGTNVDLPCKEVIDCPGGACVEVSKFDGKVARNINILLEDQLTNIRLNAGKVDFLMVPSSRCDGDNDAACVSGATAAPAAGTQEHYKCYKAKATKTVCGPGSTMNEFEACDDDAQCGGAEDSCAALTKFTKNQSVFMSGDFITGERAFGLGKISHFCKAVEKTAPPGVAGTPEGPVNPDARMICYKSKATKGACDMTSPSNAFGACKGEEDCGGVDDVTTHCDEQAKFDKENVNVLGLYANNQFDLVSGSDPNAPVDYHRTNLAKEDLVCMPACEGNDLQFTTSVLRADSLQIPSTGNPGDGQDVDNNAGTCQPGGMCMGGIDNVLGVISGFIPDLNTALQEAVEDGDINIVLELHTFDNGAQIVNGFTGELDSPAGCTDVNDPNQVCNYVVDDATVDLATCAPSSDIRFDVTVAGLPGSPATVSGGGIGSNLSFSLPFGEIPVNITARNVKVSADVTHTGGAVESAVGALGGAISQRELKAAINALPQGICDGGPNDGDPCTMATEADDCYDNNDPNNPVVFPCDEAYLGGFDKATIASVVEVFMLRDIDLDGQTTCEGGNNNGEACNPGDCNDPNNPGACPCPDFSPPSPPACDQYDAHSVGIAFTGINALISDYTRPCDKTTCSLY